MIASLRGYCVESVTRCGLNNIQNKEIVCIFVVFVTFVRHSYPVFFHTTKTLQCFSLPSVIWLSNRIQKLYSIIQNINILFQNNKQTNKVITWQLDHRCHVLPYLMTSFLFWNCQVRRERKICCKKNAYNILWEPMEPKL